MNAKSLMDVVLQVQRVRAGIQIGGRRSGLGLWLIQLPYGLAGVACGKGSKLAWMPMPSPMAQQWWLSAWMDAALTLFGAA